MKHSHTPLFLFFVFALLPINALYATVTMTLNGPNPFELEQFHEYEEPGGTLVDTDHPTADWSDVIINNSGLSLLRSIGDTAIITYLYAPASSTPVVQQRTVKLVASKTNFHPYFEGANPLTYEVKTGTALDPKIMVHCFDTDTNTGAKIAIPNTSYTVTPDTSGITAISASTPPGTYTFTINCSDSDGALASPPAVVKITVQDHVATSTGGSIGVSTYTGSPTGIVPCVGDVECSVCHAVKLAKNILDAIIFLATLVSVFLFVNAGILYLGSSTLPGNISRAHRIFTNTLIGLVITLAAWLLVDTTLKFIYGKGSEWGPWNTIICSGNPVDVPFASSTAAPGGSGGVSVSAAGNPDCQDVEALKAKYRGSDPNVDAPGLQTMIACYKSDPTVAALLSSQPIFTYDRTYPICAATNGYPVCTPGCSHSANSCHYGRGHGLGAMAADFNAKDPSETGERMLYDALRVLDSRCNGRSIFEKNHTHISMSSC